MFEFLSRGLTQASVWQMLVVLVVAGQLTMASTTLYLHRSVSHRGVDFHPLVAHWFRFWSWLTTGMITKEWAAIHRKHHARCETAEDPHSPRFSGIGEVLWRGTELYRKAALRAKTAGLNIVRNYVGNYCTSLEMAGASLTMLKLDKEIEELLAAPADIAVRVF